MSFRSTPHPRRGRTLAAASITVTMVWSLLGLGWAGAASGQESVQTVPTWYQQVIATLTPLQTSLVNGVQAVTSWREGHMSARKAGPQIARALTGLQSARAGLDKLEAPATAQTAQIDDEAALGLYVESFQLAGAATQLPAGRLVRQLQRSFERIRELGDETFDQGTATVATLLGSSVSGTDVAAAAHIPDWSALGLAPGAPLVSRWSGTTVQPVGTQPAAAWALAVQHAGAPSQSSVRAAVVARRPNATTCRHLATALDRAEITLSSAPGSASDPQGSGVVRIALLVDADAVLTAEAQALSTGGPSHTLRAVAAVLTAIGGQLRDAA